MRYRLRLYIMFGFVWEVATPFVFFNYYIFPKVEWVELLGLCEEGSFEAASVKVLRYRWLVVLCRCSGITFPLKPFLLRSAWFANWYKLYSKVFYMTAFLISLRCNWRKSFTSNDARFGCIEQYKELLTTYAELPMIGYKLLDFCNFCVVFWWSYDYIINIKVVHITLLDCFLVKQEKNCYVGSF